MKNIYRVLAALLFCVLFLFALKNTHDVKLFFIMDYELQGPMVLFLLSFFIIGAILGMLAILPKIARYKNEIMMQTSTIKALREQKAAQQENQHAKTQDVSR